jgi:hypothetical protein
MSEDFWDTLKLATLVLKPALVALRYCDGMKGGTVSLLYNLLLELDKYYSKPIKGLDEAIHKKMHNVFMSRWSAFHAPIHSAAFAMDKQFCRRQMDHGVKTDIWSVMEGRWNRKNDVPVRRRGIIQLLFIFIGKIYVRRGTVPHTVPPYFPCS